jgi:hypothetical protein
MPDADKGPPLQVECGVEGPAEDPVGGGQEGNGKMEKPLDGAGPTGG